MNTEILSIIIICIAITAIPVLSARYALKWPFLNLLGSFAGSIFYIITGTLYLNNFGPFSLISLLLLAIGCLWFPCILIRLSSAQIPLPYGDIPWWKSLAQMILAILFGVLLLTGLLVLFNVLGFMFFVFVAVGTIRYRLAARYNRALEIVSTLAAAVRQNLPLPTTLQTAAMGRKDKTAWIFSRIAYWLTQGYPLAESISKAYPQCLPDMIMTIHSAEQINQLPQTLLSLEKDLVAESDETRKVRPVHPWYPVIVLTCIPLFGAGLLIFIVPTFAAVISELSDGRSRLPASTQFLIDLAASLTQVKTLVIFAITLIVAYSGWSYYHYRTKLSLKPGPFLNLVDRIRWMMPVYNRLERNYSTLRLLEILRSALTAGLPVNQAIAAALGTKMNVCYKQRVARWLECVTNGNNASQSALDCGVGRSIAWALDDKVNPGQAPLLLEMLEENCRSKHNYIGNLIRSFSWPIFIVLLGSCVGFFVYAMFIPMVQIITICAQDINP